jgi:hypothetical protein
LKYPHKPKEEFLICGDVNTDYVNESSQKQLTSLLTTYDLSHTVSFATRIRNNSGTAIDNIYLDNSIINLSSLSPLKKAYQIMILKFTQLKTYMQQQTNFL